MSKTPQFDRFLYEAAVLLLRGVILLLVWYCIDDWLAQLTRTPALGDLRWDRVLGVFAIVHILALSMRGN
jgi:hypothetical protein